MEKHRASYTKCRNAPSLSTMATPGKKLKRQRAGPVDSTESGQEELQGGAAEPASKRPKTSRSLFVRSLPQGATNETLTEFFSQHFPVKHATVVLDRGTQTSKGFGFVTLADGDDAAEAKEKLDNLLWNGRRIRVDVAEPRHRKSDGPQSEPSRLVVEKQRREVPGSAQQAVPKLWQDSLYRHSAKQGKVERVWLYYYPR
jgi:nucleolar protein 4